MPDQLSEALRLYRAGDLTAAKSVCAALLDESPDNAMAHQIMAVALSQEGDASGAVEHLEAAVECAPEETEIRFNLAKAYRDLGRNLDAAEQLRRVTQSWPDKAQVWLELGIALSRADMLNEAAETIAKAIDLGANSAQALSNLAAIYVQVSDIDRAEAAAKQAIDTDPGFAPAWVNLGIVHESRDELAKAIQIYERVLASRPADPSAASRHALALLTSGRLEQGWRAYAHRHSWPGNITCAGQNPAPNWDGSALTGKSILIWTEQGLGDEVLCGTMINDVIDKAEKVTIACSTKIHPLFARAFADARVANRGDGSLGDLAAENFDVQASLTELGHALRSDATGFRTSKPYLRMDADRVATLRQAYLGQDTDRPLIGIAWQSGNADARRQKSSDLLAWANVLRQPNAKFISLQYGKVAPQIERLAQIEGITLETDPAIDPLSDFDAFVHQVAAMDLVISTSNTTVHTAGALGIPVWTLVPRGLGRPWYWFIDRTDSLWYPTMKLYRQSSAGDWSDPLAEISRDLSSWMTSWSD